MYKIDYFIEEKIKEGYFPGCVILIGNREDNIFHKAYGFSELTPTKREMRKDDIFDIASLTKPIATATSILILLDSRLIRLDTQVGSLLTELKGTINEGKTIFELLTHTSFFPAWYPLYLISNIDYRSVGAYPQHSRRPLHPDSKYEKEIIQFIGNMKAESPVYSCLDYILLGKIVERITGKALKEFSERNIFKPLKMIDTSFCPPQKFKMRFVATEVGNKHEKELSKKYKDEPSFKWREKSIVGEVHDGNSFYCFKGISGNAGLFSTACDIATFARILLQGGNKVIKPAIVNFLLKEQVEVLGEKRSLGFLIEGSGCGRLSQKTALHTGFTGCALWIDPEKDIFIIFLSNAVHPDVRPNILRPIRPQIVNHCLKIAM
ncbi:MAG: class A beta-lactamase-related serine hydrolase [Candidatus Cloacimonadota bacterium]|nr:MAG: class A beta-lactamase-related serine hydrolase [Candidatus Cloacimonadota bacterium]